MRLNGPSGSGRTIFAVEAAYRALRAGSRTLFIYRSHPFKHILKNLLEEVSENLFLLSYENFQTLIETALNHGVNSREFRHAGLNLFDDFEKHFEIPYWDLLIADDWDSSCLNNRASLTAVEKLSFKSIVIGDEEPVAVTHRTQSVKSDFKTVRPGEKSEATSVFKSEHTSNYKIVTLTENVRNSQIIVSHLNTLAKQSVSSGINERGQLMEVIVDWNTLDEEITALLKLSLPIYAPSQILIIVDPELKHPKVTESNQLRRSKQKLLIAESLSALPGAILIASATSSSHCTAIDSFQILINQLNNTNNQNIKLIATNGNMVKTVTIDELDKQRGRQYSAQNTAWNSVGVDAIKLLEDNALNDPSYSNAILVYPTQLSTGLEADLVIYIRNEADECGALLSECDKKAADTTVRTVETAESNHVNACARARHCLIDVKVS